MTVKMRNRIIIGAAAAVILIVLLSSIVTTVPTGYTGIVTTFGKVEDLTLEAGMRMKLPWQVVVRMDNREQKQIFKTTAFSSDIQQVDIQGSINYRINKLTAMNLYRTVGIDYFDTLIYPRLLEGVKAVFSKSSAEGLVATRDVLSNRIESVLKEAISDYDIEIVKIAIEDIDFTEAYTNAVEAKQVAEQEKLKAETDQAKLTIEKEAEAKRTVIEATAAAEAKQKAADAEAYEIKVRAEAEAEANEKISKSITQHLIEYVKWTGWNGQFPTTMAGPDAMILLDAGESGK